MENKIKPCPFCGYDYLIIDENENEGHPPCEMGATYFSIWCSSCGTVMGNAEDKTCQMAVERWNKRISPDKEVKDTKVFVGYIGGRYVESLEEAFNMSYAMCYENENIVITDPDFVIKDDDDLAKVLAHEDIIDGLKELGFNKVLCADTVTNDWGYQVIKEKDKQGRQDEGAILGEFSAENGYIAVFTLDEIKRYNPDYDHEDDENLGLAAIIRNYTGRVGIKYLPDGEASIVGYGKDMDFYSKSIM